MMNNQQIDIIPTSLAITALRDNGYKNTAYAVAELLDNSIQAGADKVELLCIEALNSSLQRPRMQISQIAVIDNGSGMDADQLQTALQFGNGSHLNATKGMGKFGMGLPNSSISQATRVEVWSWQKRKTPIYSSVDIENMGDGTVPTPVQKELPELYKQGASQLGDSGTLVVWSNLDRCLWKTALTIINNCENLIGRMYRKFIDEGKVTINFSAIDKANPNTKTFTREAKANDPLYLIVPSNTPAPYDKMPLFREFGQETKFLIGYAGEEHVVRIKYSIVLDEIRRSPKNAGATDFGKHAAKNIGVSILREGRELTVDQNLMISYDPRERFLGIEVEFPAALDKVFGVTNNKQEARNFDAVAKDFKLMDDREATDYIQEQGRRTDDLDPAAPLYDLVQRLNADISLMRDQVKAAGQGKKKGPGRHGGPTSEEIGTEAIKDRIKGGQKGLSDEEFENVDDETRKKVLSDYLVEGGSTPEHADQLAAETIDSGRRIVFDIKDLEGNAFFSVRSVAGELMIGINSGHQAYKNLVEVLDSELSDEISKDALRERLDLARDGLRLLLMAWARYEDEVPTDERRRLVQDVRSDWGRVASDFLRLNVS